jgi:hypothetical protein
VVVFDIFHDPNKDNLSVCMVEGKVDNEIDGLKKMTHIYDIQ